MANEVAPLSRRPVLTDEELNQSLDLKLNVFRNAGLRLKDLTIEDFLAINLTFEDASKALRFLESFINQQILLPLISQAEHYAVLLAKASLDAQDLWRLVNWLKTSQGAAAIRKVQTERKLLKKSTTQRSAKDVAFMRLLSQENVDLAAATKEIQSEVDAGILAHNEAIQKLKEKGERRIRKAREEYSAAANFPDPTVDKLRDLCWIQYLDKCTAEGKTPARKTNENLRKITEEYRQEVSQNVVMEYCDDEGVRQHLTEYGDKKIKHLKTHKRKREVERFRNLLTTAVGAPPVPVPTPEPASDDEGYSAGTRESEPRAAGVLETVRGEGDENFETPQRVGRAKKSKAAAGVRVGRLPSVTPVAKRTRHRGKKHRRTPAPNDPGL
ncbi:putative coat protein [Ophrys amalgavirus 1]|nr:putative coat protein [Ophrys amalgavirus 1]DAZ91034.1 TPA_asm: hypothetical protein [Ophrys fusca amalgavirus 1]